MAADLPTRDDTSASGTPPAVEKDKLDNIVFYDAALERKKFRSAFIRGRKKSRMKGIVDTKYAVIKLDSSLDLPAHMVADAGKRIEVSKIDSSDFGSMYADLVTHLQPSRFIGGEKPTPDETMVVSAAASIISEMSRNIELLTDSLRSRLDKSDHLFKNV